jgi:hypothetical protein
MRVAIAKTLKARQIPCLSGAVALILNAPPAEIDEFER